MVDLSIVFSMFTRPGIPFHHGIFVGNPGIKSSKSKDSRWWLQRELLVPTEHISMVKSYWCVKRREWGNDPWKYMKRIFNNNIIWFPHSHPFPTNCVIPLTNHKLSLSIVRFLFLSRTSRNGGIGAYHWWHSTRSWWCRGDIRCRPANLWDPWRALMMLM